MTNDDIALAFPIAVVVICAAMIFVMLWIVPTDKGDGK